VSAGDAVLTGNVTLAKGDLKVRASHRAEVRQTPHVKWARVGRRLRRRTRRPREAPEVELDLAKQVLELPSGVRLTRGRLAPGGQGDDQHRHREVTMTQVKGSVPVPPNK